MIPIAYAGFVKLLVDRPGYVAGSSRRRNIPAGSVGRVTRHVLLGPDGTVVTSVWLRQHCEEGASGFEVQIAGSGLWVYAKGAELAQASPAEIQEAEAVAQALTRLKDTLERGLGPRRQQPRIPVVSGKRPPIIWMDSDRTQLAVMSKSEAPKYRLVELHPDGSLTCTCPRGRRQRGSRCPHVREFEALKASES